jgi:7-cyano-7-deazaguanine tRNA-ribosyltransferase
MGNFEIRAKDGLARLGRLTTKHGTVRTPLLMPVVHPGKALIRPQELVNGFGFEMIITNSYIIDSHDSFREKALTEGVHGLLDFDRPIMTDSGTFQMYFHDLPTEEIDPLAIIEFQKKIGTDIGTILDAFSKPDVSRTQVEKDVELSLDRARASVGIKEDMMLAGTIQGGNYEDLRAKSAREMAKMDFDVYPIGGVVPFMEMYRYADIVRITLETKKYLPVNRPVHLFGCGHPMLFAQAAYLGCDLFDSASYAKFADSGRMLLTSGTVHLNDLTELPCDCPICSNTSADDLKSFSKNEKSNALMRHNLYVSAGEMRRVRQAIVEGKLFELVALRARSHPTLLEAFHAMIENMEQIVGSDPFGKSSSIFYTGAETIARPEIARFHSRLIERYPYRETNVVVVVPDIGGRPFRDTANTIIDEVRKHAAKSVILLFVTPMGVIPWELEHVHPAQQCIFPNTIDQSTLRSTERKLCEFLETMSFNRLVWFETESPTNCLVEALTDVENIIRVSSTSEAQNEFGDSSAISDWTLRKLKAVLCHQWGSHAGALTEKADLHVLFSRSTGKIRYIKSGDDILFTMVPTTGLLTPTHKGGQELLQAGLDPQYVVTMDNEVAEFVADGKSALAKFVKKSDPNLRAGEEVVVVDQSNNLLATGKALLSGEEMAQFTRGVAVLIRHSLDHYASA